MTMYVRPLIDPLLWYPFFQSGNSGFFRAAPDWLPPWKEKCPATSSDGEKAPASFQPETWLSTFHLNLSVFLTHQQECCKSLWVNEFYKITERMIFSGRLERGIKKMAALFFTFPRHSEPHFKLKTSEFRCKMKF